MKIFELTYRKRTFVRWNNRKDFVESIDEINLECNSRQIALFFLTYNLSNSVIKLLSKLDEERDRNKFDIVIVDNHSKDEEFHAVKDFLEKQKILNVTLIRTKDNLGGAGGNAIAMEYILSKDYEYLIFTEDDAFPKEKNLVTNMIKAKNKKGLVRVQSYDYRSPGNPFHYMLYPISFIKLLGIPNPSLFMRADDEDFNFRIQKIMNDFDYKYIDIRDSYIHPMIKKGAGKYRHTYFSVRNAFMTKTRYFSQLNIVFAIKDLFKEFCILFGYFRTGFSKLFIESNYKLLLTIFIALWDYILGNINYKNNKEKLSYLGKWQNNPKLNVNYRRETFENLDKLTVNKYLLDSGLKGIKTYKLKFSKIVKKHFTSGCILYTFNLPLYPCIFFSPMAISVEEYNMNNKEAYIGTLEGQRTIKNIVLVFVSLLLSIIFFVPISLILLVKIVLFKIIRLLGK